MTADLQTFTPTCFLVYITRRMERNPLRLISTIGDIFCAEQKAYFVFSILFSVRNTKTVFFSAGFYFSALLKKVALNILSERRIRQVEMSLFNNLI